MVRDRGKSYWYFAPPVVALNDDNLFTPALQRIVVALVDCTDVYT